MPAGCLSPSLCWVGHCKLPGRQGEPFDFFPSLFSRIFLPAAEGETRNRPAYFCGRGSRRVVCLRRGRSVVGSGREEIENTGRGGGGRRIIIDEPAQTDGGRGAVRKSQRLLSLPPPLPTTAEEKKEEEVSPRRLSAPGPFFTLVYASPRNNYETNVFLSLPRRVRAPTIRVLMLHHHPGETRPDYPYAPSKFAKRRLRRKGKKHLMHGWALEGGRFSR